MNSAKLLRLPVVFATVVIMFTLLDRPRTAASAVVPDADGFAVFTAKCASCHGKNGEGLPNWREKGQPDFTNFEWQRSHSDSHLIASIKYGKGKYMPAFKEKLSDEEIEAVVKRIRAFSKKR